MYKPKCLFEVEYEWLYTVRYMHDVCIFINMCFKLQEKGEIVSLLNRQETRWWPQNNCHVFTHGKGNTLCLATVVLGTHQRLNVLKTAQTLPIVITRVTAMHSHSCDICMSENNLWLVNNVWQLYSPPICMELDEPFFKIERNAESSCRVWINVMHNIMCQVASIYFLSPLAVRSEMLFCRYDNRKQIFLLSTSDKNKFYHKP